MFNHHLSLNFILQTLICLFSILFNWISHHKLREIEIAKWFYLVTVCNQANKYTKCIKHSKVVIIKISLPLCVCVLKINISSSAEMKVNKNLLAANFVKSALRWLQNSLVAYPAYQMCLSLRIYDAYKCSLWFYINKLYTFAKKKDGKERELERAIRVMPLTDKNIASCNEIDEFHFNQSHVMIYAVNVCMFESHAVLVCLSFQTLISVDI